MTEQDWLTSTDPIEMLRIGDGQLSQFRFSPRKLRLFAVACCRQVWQLLVDDVSCERCGGTGNFEGEFYCEACDSTGRVNRSQRAVEVAERYVDGLATEKERSRAWLYIDMEAEHCPAWIWASMALEREMDLARGRPEALAIAPPAAQAALLREIVGCPWRPVSAYEECESCRGGGEVVTPSGVWGCHLCGGNGHCPGSGRIAAPWLTPTVQQLARSAYEERTNVPCERCDGLKYVQTADGSGEDCPACHGSGVTFHGALDPGTLTVLADALEDAGCTDEAILRHLRGWERCPRRWKRYVKYAGGAHSKTCDCGGTGWRPLRAPHVRGCWAVDALLGKE